MKQIIRLFAISVSFILASFAQQANRTIPAGAKLYIEEMEHDFDGYLRAEIVKKKIPLVIVLNREEADFIMTGSATEQEARKWHEGWLTVERDKTTGNVTILDAKTNEFLWAAEAGDRSLWWGAMARGGHRKVAERIVKNLRKVIQK